GNGAEDVPTLSDVVITKHVDGNSAALFAAAAHHTNLGNATIQVPAAGGAGPVTIHLHDVTINGFSMSGSNAGAEESLSLHFDDISYNGADFRLPTSGEGSTTTTDTSAPSPSPSSTGWNLTTNTNP
ncbi:MAG TPA: type VI secretion system tube protein Hcp, partial [Acidothermaceae bacterium]|nr:type VI secretion system tube protein Hcp [Acidothermaceae bacterium]